VIAMAASKNEIRRGKRQKYRAMNETKMQFHKLAVCQATILSIKSQLSDYIYYTALSVVNASSCSTVVNT